MFERWGFLLGEIWGLLAIAGLLGLFVGWLIWGRRKVELAAAPAAAAATPVSRDSGDISRLRADLAACTERGRSQAERIALLETEARGARAAADAARAETARLEAARTSVLAAPVAAVSPPVMPSVASVAPALATKPAGLAAARGGKADDLKLIKGVGPKLEALCHRLGFYHFDQIAGWTAAEIAWVDENLEGFKGRVTRDEWVAQARDLAAGLPPRAGGEN